MKKLLLLTLLILSITGFISLNSCKKEKNINNDDYAAQSAAADDEAGIASATDQALTDVNSAIDGSSFAQRSSDPNQTNGIHPICGGTIDSSQKSEGIIIINFDGTTNCNGRTRSGQIKIEKTAGSKWRDAGTTINITFINFKVTRIRDNKSIVINGSKSITNITGGLVRDLQAGQSLVHKVRGSLSVTFNNNTTRSWNVARKNTYAMDSNNVRWIKIEGDTTIGSDAHVVVWGVNRNNDNFEVVINTPIEANSTCEFDEPVKGVKVHKKLARELTVTFGVDAHGDPVSSGCAYGFKAEWENARGQHRELIVEYR